MSEEFRQIDRVEEGGAEDKRNVERLVNCTGGAESSEHPTFHDAHGVPEILAMIRSALERYSLARVARQQCTIQRRHFSIPNSKLRADLVQDLYLKEIRNYKAPPLKASDSEGHVQKFSAPKSPQTPEDGDIARDLKDYENQQVELEGQATTGDGGASEESWFEDELDDEGVPAAH